MPLNQEEEEYIKRLYPQMYTRLLYLRDEVHWEAKALAEEVGLDTFSNCVY